METIKNFQEAKSLIEYARETLNNIKVSYEESLSEKKIKPRLLIDVKSFMENLRSALDYSAHGLYEKYGETPKKNREIYFPYARPDVSLTAFRTKNVVNRKIPGLVDNRPDIAEKIETYQHFSSTDNLWLPKFMDINNTNKHRKLTPQVVEKQLTTTFPTGMKMVFNTEGGIKANKIIIGDQVIEGGQTFGPDNPLPAKGAHHENKIWASFNFELYNEPVLPFLSKALTEVEKIVIELSLI